MTGEGDDNPQSSEEVVDQVGRQDISCLHV